MTAIAALRRHLLGASTNPITKETAVMPSSIVVDTRLAELTDELAHIEAAKATDPISSAADVSEWSTRDSERTSRSLELAQEIEQIRRHGALVADPDVAAAVATFTKTTRDFRLMLRPVINNVDLGRRQLDGQGGVTQCLELWWRAIKTLIAALPHDDTAARELIRTELDTWFATRASVYRAAIQQLGNRGLPHPEGENGELPAGLRLGVHPGP